jgi:hypothetical protein
MARLTRLLADPLSVPAAKLEEFQWRLNVLTSFVPLATAKPAKPKRRGKAKPPAGGRAEAARARSGAAAGGAGRAQKPAQRGPQGAAKPKQRPQSGKP